MRPESDLLRLQGIEALLHGIRETAFTAQDIDTTDAAEMAQWFNDNYEFMRDTLKTVEDTISGVKGHIEKRESMIIKTRCPKCGKRFYLRRR